MAGSVRQRKARTMILPMAAGKPASPPCRHAGCMHRNEAAGLAVSGVAHGNAPKPAEYAPSARRRSPQCPLDAACLERSGAVANARPVPAPGAKRYVMRADIRHVDAADFLPRPCSLLHCSPVPAPCSPSPCSLFPVPRSLFPVPLLPWQQPTTNDRHRGPGCPSSWKERIRASAPPCGRRPHGLSVPSHRHLPGAARCGAREWKCLPGAASARSAVAAILRQPLPQAPAAAEARSRSWPAAPCMAPIDRTPGRHRCT